MISVHHVSHMMTSHTNSRQTPYFCNTILAHVTILNTAQWDQPTPPIFKQISINSFHLLFWFFHSSFPVNCPQITTQQSSPYTHTHTHTHTHTLLITNQALTTQFSMSLNVTFSEYMSMSLTSQLSHQ
jgi:hypothetical protein